MSTSPSAHLRAARRPVLELIPDVSWVPTATVGLLALVLLVGDVLFYPASVALGSRGSEAPGHVWGLWATASRIFEYGPLVRVADLSWPAGFAAHLMDPINLLIFLPFFAIGGGEAAGATLGWNALHVGASALATLGCYRLGRRVLGADPATPWAVALLGGAFAASPYLLSTPSLGRTELLPAVLWPLHLALLHAWSRIPVGEGPGVDPAPSWKVGALAGISLGAMALGGWYLCVFLALLEPVVALWMTRRLGLRERAWRLAFVALIGVICALPALWATITFPPPTLSAMPTDAPMSPDSFTRYGLAQLLRVRVGSLAGVELPPYVGVITLGLGLVGAIRAPRRALPWLLIGVLTLLLAYGPYARWIAPSGPPRPGQTDALLTMPAAWLMSLVPKLALLRHWSRLTLLASLPMGLAAMEGFRAIAPSRGGRRAAVAVLLLGAMTLDHASWPSAWSLPRPSFQVTPPPALTAALDALPPGPVLLLPLEGKAGDPHDGFGQGMYQLWQLSHGRPISAGGLGEEDISTTMSALTGAVRQYQMATARRGPQDQAERTTLSAEALACAREGGQVLHSLGFAGVVLHIDREQGAKLSAPLTSILGAPTWSGSTVQAWDLDKVTAPEETPAEAVCARYIPRSL